MNEVTSTFQRSAAYRYIRRTDALPTYAELGYDTPLSEIVCKVRLFNPTGIGTWWIAAFDPDTQIAWGVAELTDREVGSFSMDELTAFRDSRFGLPIERDLHYTPTTIEDLIA